MCQHHLCGDSTDQRNVIGKMNTPNVVEKIAWLFRCKSIYRLKLSISVSRSKSLLVNCQIQLKINSQSLTWTTRA